MLSNGQIEVQKIINSFLKEYENLKEKDSTPNEYRMLYEKVRNAFCSNDIIRSDSVTSQLLGTSQYSQKYLEWLRETGEKEKIEIPINEDFPTIDFPMKEILYPLDGNLKPAYEGGIKWDSTISCLFGLAQRRHLDRMICGGEWTSIYYDAIQLWEAGSGGHHRLLSHILFGSNKINPLRLTIYRNTLLDTILNKSLRQFDDLFNDINSDNSNLKNNIELTFNIETLSEKSTAMIKEFFYDLRDDEKAEIIKSIRAIKIYSHKYIAEFSWRKEIEIENMYRLLIDIRSIKSKPRWHRKLLILKQKLLGVEAVDPITCSVLQLGTDFNDEGLLRCVPVIRNMLLKLFK